MRIHLTEGQRVPILLGSSGRFMAAHMGLSRAAVERDFRLLRWQKPIDFQDYYAQVEEARRTGYGIDEGFYARGVTSIGTAILDRQRQPRYSVTAVMFQGQYDRAVLDEIGGELKVLADEMARALALPCGLGLRRPPHSRSMIVAVAMPVAQHTVCRPWRKPRCSSA